jgi:hypothetical protein
MSKIRVPTDELAKSFRIWLNVIAQRQPSILRDLWTRKGEQKDSEKIAFARDRLAKTLADNLALARWQVMRNETMHDRTDRLAEEE